MNAAQVVGAGGATDEDRGGLNPDPPSWGSQFGAAGKAEEGVVVVLVLGAVVEGGLSVVVDAIDADVLDERGSF